MVEKVVLGKEDGDIITLWGSFRSRSKVEIDANGAKVIIKPKDDGVLINVNGKPIYFKDVGPLRFVFY